MHAATMHASCGGQGQHLDPAMLCTPALQCIVTVEISSSLCGPCVQVQQRATTGCSCKRCRPGCKLAQQPSGQGLIWTLDAGICQWDRSSPLEQIRHCSSEVALGHAKGLQALHTLGGPVARAPWRQRSWTHAGVSSLRAHRDEDAGSGSSLSCSSWAWGHAAGCCRDCMQEWRDAPQPREAGQW